jgi:copper oxidase (laccase) domain-containing protein
VDLVASLQQEFRAGGVLPAHIDVVDACTSCDAERFFSHRRDAAKNDGCKGLHLAFIECRFA